MIRICPTCNKQFEAVCISQRYCCAACRPRNRDIIRICQVCGKAFKPNLLHRIHCSNECADYAQKSTKKSKPKTKEKRTNLSEEFNKQRLQHQREAFMLGVSYGQYIAWLQAGLLPQEENKKCQSMLKF